MHRKHGEFFDFTVPFMTINIFKNSMKKRIAMGFLLFSVILLSGCSQKQTNQSNQPEQTSKIQQQLPPVIDQQNQNESTRVYRDVLYKFSIDVPLSFFDEGATNGLYAYNKYFTSKQINGNFAKLSSGDVQVEIVISKDEKQINNDEQLKQVAISKIPVLEKRIILVDGVSAIQQIEDTKNLKNADDPGCSISTYFMKNGKSHSISIFSPGGCDTIKKFQKEYDTMVGSVQY